MSASFFSRMILGEDNIPVKRNGILSSVMLRIGLSPAAFAFNEVGADMMPADALPLLTLVKTAAIS